MLLKKQINRSSDFSINDSGVNYLSSFVNTFIFGRLLVYEYRILIYPKFLVHFKNVIKQRLVVLFKEENLNIFESILFILAVDP